MDSLYLDIELEESVDAFNDVLLTTWQPHGLTRFFMAPRRLRMRRLWRCDFKATGQHIKFTVRTDGRRIHDPAKSENTAPSPSLE
jgi:hypothetical protein